MMFSTGVQGLVDGAYWKALLKEGAEVAFDHVRARLIETSVLSNPKISEIALYWDLYVGRHDQVVQERLKSSLFLISHFRVFQLPVQSLR